MCALLTAEFYCKHLIIVSYMHVDVFVLYVAIGIYTFDICSIEDPPCSKLVGPVNSTITVTFLASATITTTLA